MKLKNKMIVLLFIMFTILLVAPSMVNAAETYTYQDTAQGIEWSYELDESGNIINLKCNTTTKTGAVTIPNNIDGKTVTSLKGGYSDGAFQKCYGITSVTIPNTITVIGMYAFESCTGLKTVTIPNSITKIEPNVFRNCSGLESINLPERLTSIGGYAFANCSKLKSITIPNGVTTIGENAFKNCSSLKELTLPENIIKIAAGTFYGCSGITSLIIPNSVTTIETESFNSPFEGCTNLAKILIPDSVATIANGVFGDCDKLTIYGTEGEASHTYAQENNINFKLISEWNNAGVGDDISGPQVEKIEVTRACLDGLEEDDGMWMFPTGKKVVINVYFTEVVHGDTAPTLTIRCGQGSNIELTNGTISSKHVIYEYTIKQGDIGIMSTVSLDGGNLADSTGNAAKLSCPRLEVDWVSISEEYVYANGTTANPEDDQTGEWTDFSKAKFEFKKNGTAEANLEITGVTPKEGSVYYLFITSNSNKPNVTSDDENKMYLRYNKEDKKFTAVGMAKYIELNQDLYITILETQSYQSEKIVLSGKKLERFAEPKYSDAFFATFMTNDTNQIVTMFTHDSNNNRKIQIKIGKITDLSILQRIKNQDVSGFASLLTFAKSNKGMYDKLLDATKNNYAIGYDANKDENTLIDLKNLEDEAYYFLYVKTYDEDGKYVSNEAVTLAQANVFSDYWSLFFYGDNDFKWADFGDVEEDDSKAPGVLPDTGKFTIVSILFVTAVAGVRSFIKTRKYRGI